VSIGYRVIRSGREAELARAISCGDDVPLTVLPGSFDMSSDHDVPRWPAAEPVGGPVPPAAPPISGFGPPGWPAAYPVEVRRFQPVGALGDASTVLICLTALALVGSTAADWNTYLVARTTRVARRRSPPQT
jgi:hypothetical protein